MADVPVRVTVEGAEAAMTTMKKLGGIIAGVFAVEKIVAFAKKGIEEHAKLQKASMQLTQALGKEATALIDLAKASTKHTDAGKISIIDGYKRLALYGMTEDQIKKLSPVMLDLAQSTGDAESAAALLGRAVETGSGRLSMYGVVVNKHVTVQERLNSIIQQGTSLWGGQAQAAYDAMTPMQKWDKIVNKSAESLGDALAPDLKLVTDNMTDLGDVVGNITRVVLTAFKGVVFVIDLTITGLSATITGWIFLMSKIPVIGKHFEGAVRAMDEVTRSFAKTTAGVGQSIADTWDKTKEEQNKAMVAMRKQTMQDALEKEKEIERIEKEKERVAKDALEKEKQHQKEVSDLLAEVSKKNSQLFMDDNQKKINDLDIAFGEQYTMLEGHLEAQKQLGETYETERNSLVQAGAEEKWKKNKEWLDKEADDMAEQNKMKADAEQDKINARIANDKAAKRAQGQAMGDTTNMLKQLASKHKEFTGAYKTMAIAQATVDTFKSAQSIYAGFSTIPIIGQALGIAGAAAAIAFGLSNVKEIATAKMAYGGVVTGGTPGQDSVPAMLMPGEIVYNPAHPNSELAGMVSNTTSNTHFHSGDIVIQGNADSNTVSQIREVSETAVLNAIRRAQNMGKLSASGLTVRG